MSLWLACFGLFVAQAAPTAEALQAAWQAVAGAVSAGARFPLTPRPSDLATVAAGGVARRRLADPQGDRAMGVGWSPYSQAALWVGIIDDQHFTLVKGLREQQLPGTTLTRKLLFQHLDLPWPLSDRQWVIELRNNEPLWRSTGGAAWERYWTLADAALAIDPNPEGVWLPACEGAWLLVDTHPGTLVVYQARTEIGGIVSPDVATTWALTTVESLMKAALGRASAIPGHYGATHAPIAAPDGRALQEGDVKASAGSVKGAAGGESGW
jgi:hypothetical protein